MATVTGRKVADETGTRTNMYVLGVAKSGKGKEHAREVNKKLLELSGGEAEYLAAEGVGSSQGLVGSLTTRPCLLFQLDEIGRTLEGIRRSSTAPHIQSITTVLLRLYSSSKSKYITDAVVDQSRVKTIDQPHCVVYGTTVPKSLFAALTPDSVTDGFMSRLLIFEAANNDPDPAFPTSKPPGEDLIEQVAWWCDYYYAASGGNLARYNPTPRPIIATAEAAEVFRALSEHAREQERQSGDAGTLWTRAHEKARKLALVHACSLHRDATEIATESAAWAAELVCHLTERLIWLAETYVSENQTEDVAKRLIRIIAHNPSGVTGEALCAKSRWLSRRDRKDTLESLLESGEIIVERETSGGRPRLVYKRT
jgi:hypothetical protein